jgi:hypothetical protein
MDSSVRYFARERPLVSGRRFGGTLNFEQADRLDPLKYFLVVKNALVIAPIS